MKKTFISLALVFIITPKAFAGLPSLFSKQPADSNCNVAIPSYNGVYKFPFRILPDGTLKRSPVYGYNVDPGASDHSLMVSVSKLAGIVTDNHPMEIQLDDEKRVIQVSYPGLKAPDSMHPVLTYHMSYDNSEKQCHISSVDAVDDKGQVSLYGNIQMCKEIIDELKKDRDNGDAREKRLANIFDNFKTNTDQAQAIPQRDGMFSKVIDLVELQAYMFVSHCTEERGLKAEMLTVEDPKIIKAEQHEADSVLIGIAERER